MAGSIVDNLVQSLFTHLFPTIPPETFMQMLDRVRPGTRNIDPNAEFGSFYDTEDYMPGSDKRGLQTEPRTTTEAQGARGSRVPQGSMFDVPPILMLPQTGSETDTHILSQQQLQGVADQKRSEELLSRLHELNQQIQKSPGSSDPKWEELQSQFDDVRNQLQDIHNDFLANTRPGRMLKNVEERQQNVPSDVDAILKGIQQQKQLPPPTEQQPSTVPMSGNDFINTLMQLAHQISPPVESPDTTAQLLGLEGAG